MLLSNLGHETVAEAAQTETTNVVCECCSSTRIDDNIEHKENAYDDHIRG
jgi:hypothetical protein